MSFEPIQRVEIKDFGCVRDLALNLGRLHALIGPNDSGKSTILRAIRTATQFAVGTFTDDTGQGRQPFDPLFLNLSQGGSSILLRFQGALDYRVHTAGADGSNTTQSPRIHVYEQTNEGSGLLPSLGRQRPWQDRGLLHQPLEKGEYSLRDKITTATMVRFDPNALRRPSRQILSSEPIAFTSETGEGLASVYQAINSRDVDAFVAIRDQVKKFFPTIQNILVPTVKDNKVTLQLRLTDGTVVEAPAISEGILYLLGFAALQHLTGSKLFLIEEPENGVHPVRIAELIEMLRQLSKTSQVIMATHSPMVANALEGDEISVVTRDPEKGTQAFLLKDTPNYAARSEIYLNGELWVAYGDGFEEKSMVQGGPRR